MSGRLDGKVALVTGGGSGIGRACVGRLVADGARVAVADLRAEAAEEVAAEHGDAAAALVADVTDEAQVEAMVASTVDRYGRLDIGVNNAGVGGFAPIVDHPLDLWRRIHALCLEAVFTCVKHQGRVLVEQGDGGSIVNIASMNATQPAQGLSAYCSAKAGVAMLSEVAAMELGPHRIRVNAVAPGLIETPLAAGLHQNEAILADFQENQPVPGLGQPEDVAAVVAFLASDDARLVNGDLVQVDGGATTGRYPRLFDHFSD
ncbi:MAG: SDR family NAD(P)-dependent oxidoreductase [Actinomycetota bacterium]